jgi:hypothetical protein
MGQTLSAEKDEPSTDYEGRENISHVQLKAIGA